MTKRRVTNPTILDAIDHPSLFAPWFRDKSTWTSWLVFLAVMFGLPLRTNQLALYRQCTDRNEAPNQPHHEGWLICGRRAGKSFVLALIAVFLACFRDYRQYLLPGERGTILIIAADRRQARVIFRYVRGLLTNVRMLADMIERETSDAFDLKNSITIEIAAGSFRTTRGYTLVAALCDEIAYWSTDEDSADPDVEILTALRPGMATIPGAILLCASSPYARRGALWDAYRRHFGQDRDPILVWRAGTRTMNPTVPQLLINKALERDPAAAGAEWLAEFRTDVELFINREVVEAAIQSGCRELAAVSSARYVAFCDPSGGSSDSMTLAIAHRDDERGVLDCVREIRPPFSPDAAVSEFASCLKSYNLTTVVGDRYAGAWPVERFNAHGIKYEASEKTKSQIYGELLPLLNSARVDLLDNPRLLAQLCALERKTARGGRDSIDHPPGGHDDLSNAAGGALTLCIGTLSEREQNIRNFEAWGRLLPIVRAM